MKLIVIGPKGKMGRQITKVADEMDGLDIISGIGPKGRDYIGQDIGSAAALGRCMNAPVSDDLESVIEECDVIIDFSTVELSMQVLEAAVKHKKALVCGTTGFSAEQMAKFKEAAPYIPILYAANTSRIVNLMHKLLEICADAVGADADIEIIEMHDRWKKDAPSGTSKEMGEIIAHSLEKELEPIAVYGRHGKQERTDGTIGYHSVRSGNISSSHTVMFGFLGERLEITHHAYDWECFARGACESALFLNKKENGFYTIKDVLGL